MLSTRADPVLRLQRLRVAGELTEIRARDLAFTKEEARLLEAELGLALSEADRELLHARTEGWAAGLRLAALSLAGHPDPHGFLESFAGDDRAVSDYLLSEVLARQSAETLDFLLRPASSTGSAASWPTRSPGARGAHARSSRSCTAAAC